MSTTKDSVHSRIVNALEKMVEPKGSILKTGPKDNKGPLIGRLFVWQEVKQYATAREKETWKEVYDEGLIPTDDELRERAGQRIIAESLRFSIISETGTPQRRFSLDEFIHKVAQKYKIRPSELTALADEECRLKGKPPLSKGVVEITDGAA